MYILYHGTWDLSSNFPNYFKEVHHVELFILFICFIIGLMTIEVARGFIDMLTRSGSDDHWIPGAIGIVLLLALIGLMFL